MMAIARWRKFHLSGNGVYQDLVIWLKFAALLPLS
jgi:hypothetical protein